MGCCPRNSPPWPGQGRHQIGLEGDYKWIIGLAAGLLAPPARRTWRMLSLGVVLVLAAFSATALGDGGVHRPALPVRSVAAGREKTQAITTAGATAKPTCVLVDLGMQYRRRVKPRALA